MRAFATALTAGVLLGTAGTAAAQGGRPPFPPKPDYGYEPAPVPPPALLPDPRFAPQPFAAPGGSFGVLPPAGPYGGPYGPLPPGYPPGGFPPPVPPEGAFYAFEKPHPLQEYAWLYNEVPRPREIKVHDLVTVIVKEQSETTVDNRFNRNRTATLKAELKEFLRLDDDGNLTNAALNSPKIDANLQGRLQSQGTMVEREGMIYRIAATVVDVLPNGNVVLEARKSLRTNRDVWEYSLTGTLRSQDVYRDNTCLSENIANLRIEKKLRGKVNDSTRIPWGTRLYDWFFPF